jgi:hypothetical protein
MLAYLDALLVALSSRDRAGIRQLLDHPLVRILSADARAEVESFAAGSADALAAPLRVMQLRYQMSELLRDASSVADRMVEEPSREQAVPTRAQAPTLRRRPSRLVQMELPLSA